MSPLPLYGRVATLIAVLWLTACSEPLPPEDLNLRLPGGEDVPVQRHAADGDRLVLWLPSGFGVRPGHERLGGALAAAGVEVWVVDLHTAYFEPQGAGSVDAFVPEDIAYLVDQAIARGKRDVYIVSSGGGARPALKAIRSWQLAHPGAANIRGAILFHPVLYAQQPGLGEDASYLPVTAETNVPVFIVQPELSTTSLRVTSLVERLGSGGAQVLLRRLPGAKDGYHLRSDDALTEADQRERAALPDLMLEAINKLGRIRTPAGPATARVDEAPPPPRREGGLVTWTRGGDTPALQLEDLAGRLRDLAEFRGEVVVVSFWASWCPPCIREMPSQERLLAQLKDRRFRILAVNVGEDRAAVDRFLDEHKVSFTILRDPDQRAYEDWKVYVVPTNYILDRYGRIRYGSVGAVDWESSGVVDAVNSLLEEPGPGRDR